MKLGHVKHRTTQFGILSAIVEVEDRKHEALCEGIDKYELGLHPGGINTVVEWLAHDNIA